MWPILFKLLVCPIFPIFDNLKSLEHSRLTFHLIYARIIESTWPNCVLIHIHKKLSQYEKLDSIVVANVGIAKQAPLYNYNEGNLEICYVQLATI